GHAPDHPVDGNRIRARLQEVHRLIDADREILPVDAEDVARLVDVRRRAGLVDRARARGDLAPRGACQRHTARAQQHHAAEQHHQAAGNLLALLVPPALPTELDLAITQMDVVHERVPLKPTPAWPPLAPRPGCGSGAPDPNSPRGLLAAPLRLPKPLLTAAAMVVAAAAGAT